MGSDSKQGHQDSKGVHMALIAASGVAHKEHNVLVLQPDAKKILSGEPANETPSAGRIGSRWPDQHRAARGRAPIITLIGF
jgi:hypothetical protein